MQDINSEERVQPDVLAAALDYAERGWRVFPLYEPDLTKRSRCTCGKRKCDSPGKHPRIRAWQTRATTDREQIEKWWGRWPTANVGIATGKGLLVVDVDPRNGGTDSLAELETEHEVLFTRTVRTGSGGKHLYLKVDREVRCQNNWRPGIDLKGDGGYVVAPPSRHVMGSYELKAERSLAKAPRWLLEGARTGAVEVGTSRGMCEAELESLAAPGETPEERIRWTREAVAAIRHDHRFDDRSAWIGMAHAIRVACGAGAEEEGFEIFDEFSQRWPGPYDFDETRRVWDTLGAPRDTGGYRKLVGRARSDGYEYLDDHPWNAQNEFEVDYSPVLPAVMGKAGPYPSPFKSLDEEWSWEYLLDAVRLAHNLMPLMPSEQARALESLMLSKIMNKARSWPAAQQFWHSLSPVDQRSVEVIDGKTIIRPADPTNLDLEEDYLVDGLVPVAAVGELIADYSMGKTWLLLDLALSVCFGRPFFGRVTQKGPVLYLAYEGQRGLWKRAAGWLRAHDLVPEEFTLEELDDLLADRLIIAEIPPRFDQGQVEALIRDTVRHHGVRLVIIDTRGKSLGGDLDENSADSANLVQGVLSAIADQTGATLISAHHKPLAGGDRGRGSSAWTQGADFAFTITGTRDDFNNGKPVTLKTIKFRDDENPRPLSFRLRSPVEMSVDGTTWKSAVVEPVTPREAIPQSVRALVFAEISRDAGRGLEKIRKSVTGGHDSIDQAIDDLIRMGAVEDRRDGRGHHYYPVPGWQLDGLGDVRHGGDDFGELTELEVPEAVKAEPAAPTA